jgi:hypothetical protein
MNILVITVGGTAIFLAVLRLLRQLFAYQSYLSQPGAIRIEQSSHRNPSALGVLKFYLAGLAFLLLGILVGTGLWQGWSVPLGIAIPKEVHVHANLWGFTALVFAGLMVDFAPRLTGQRQSGRRGENLIFVFLSLGALGLVLGPWLDIDLLQVLGLIAHTAGSILLVWQVIWPVRKGWRQWSPGLWHILAGYVWFFLPVVVAPLVVINMGIGTEVAGSGGPILIFGWIVQLISAFIPAFLRMKSSPGLALQPGGSWISLAAANSGSLVYWISLFTPIFRSPLRGLAFLLWLIALLPILVEIIHELQVIQESFEMISSDLSR